MGIWEDVTAVALAVHRLSEAEKKLAEEAAETRNALKEIRGQLQDLRERQLRIEARLDGLDDLVTTKAQASAAYAVSQALAGIAERLTRLEMAAPVAESGARPPLPSPRGSGDE